MHEEWVTRDLKSRATGSDQNDQAYIETTTKIVQANAHKQKESSRFDLVRKESNQKHYPVRTCCCCCCCCCCSDGADFIEGMC